jgi:hypothetical protein
MWILSFYRFYCSVAAGIAAGLLCRSVWIGIGMVVLVRSAIFAVESLTKRVAVDASYNAHAAEFKQLYGPYGIRIANKAESDRRIKISLVEVFTDNPKTLKKNVEQLEVMDTLFKAGMQPQGDEFLLHDLKLKYGKHRLNAG